MLIGYAESTETIAARHWPTYIIKEAPEQSSALICGRCESLWPCDARVLLDRLGVSRKPFENSLGHVVDAADRAATPAAEEG